MAEDPKAADRAELERLKRERDTRELTIEEEARFLRLTQTLAPDDRQ